MTLQIHTARISTRDPDRFDITRGSGGVAGAPFAPSNDILQPALRDRERARKLFKLGRVAEACQLENALWERYTPLYLAEMRGSYVRHREAWDALLARPRVVLTCYCAAWPGQPLHCHRVLLAERCLVPCGAVYFGELAA